MKLKIALVDGGLQSQPLFAMRSGKLSSKDFEYRLETGSDHWIKFIREFPGSVELLQIDLMDGSVMIHPKSIQTGLLQTKRLWKGDSLTLSLAEVPFVLTALD